MMQISVHLNEVTELREKLKDYLYLYYITKDDSFKTMITSVDTTIKTLEKMINTKKGEV